MELIHAMVGKYQGISVFADIGERSREGHEPLHDMQRSEYFRGQEHQNVLLLMDNVFRFVQAGSVVSGLLGRLPSRVDYQPTLATEVAALQERIASVAGASITAIEAVYVPADDFTDPAVTALSSHLESAIVLSREMAAEGIYPAVDPLASSSLPLDPPVVGRDHYDIAEQVRKRLAHWRELRDVIALLGVEELGTQDRQIVTRARQLRRFLTGPFTMAVIGGVVGEPQAKEG